MTCQHHSSQIDRLPDWQTIEQLPTPWNLYKDLISGIPEDIGVLDLEIGQHWVYLKAESGSGMALAVTGGTGNFALADRALHMTLRDVACQCTSWNFLSASVGVAALNAWYSTPEHAKAAGMKIEEHHSNDGFDLYQRVCQGKKVTVVGHFPLIERLADQCDLTVLERNPHGDDVPDPGCEYLVPSQDFTFMTGITLTNKTMPRLLELSRSGSTVLVGPSVVPAPALFKYGVDCMAGSIVDDPEQARHAIMRGGTSNIFGHGIQKMRVERPGWVDSLN
ncbi:MAG: DUF364 domain-containing protein [Eggerthellaceae bacterium]|jgi:uncharacterized protein (DUF4213/DUF364 family)|nr:DUF364 domain-containing protein [Eggerthellaceae bacterium]MCH4220529.1 DUF364 domain-containing protein [Eggerthellaceae bacterium]